MANKAINWALRLDLKPAEKFVLVVLANRANQVNECFPSLKSIEMDTGFNHSTVVRAIKGLLASGLIQRKNRGQKTSVYTLAVGAHSTNSKTIGRCIPHQPIDAKCTTVGAESTRVGAERTKVGAQCTTEPKGTLKEPTIEPTALEKSTQTLEVSRSNKERPASGEQHESWQRAWAAVETEMRKQIEPAYYAKYYEGIEVRLFSQPTVILAVPQAFLNKQGNDAADVMARKIESARAGWLRDRSLQLVPLD